MNALPRRRVRPLYARHKPSIRGFTVIEMLVVMGVVMTLAAMALPRMQSSMASYRLRSSVSTVSGAIQSTRYQAISQGCPFQIVFTQSTGTYQLTSDPTVTGVFGNVGNAVPFGNTSTTLGANATLQFGGGGSVKATLGTTTLVLTGSGRTGTITVSNYGNVNIVYGP